MQPTLLRARLRTQPLGGSKGNRKLKKKETYRSNTQNNHAYRVILILGRNMGMDNTIT